MLRGQGALGVVDFLGNQLGFGRVGVEILVFLEMVNRSGLIVGATFENQTELEMGSGVVRVGLKRALKGFDRTGIIQPTHTAFSVEKMRVLLICYSTAFKLGTTSKGKGQKQR